MAVEAHFVQFYFIFFKQADLLTLFLCEAALFTCFLDKLSCCSAKSEVEGEGGRGKGKGGELAPITQDYGIYTIQYHTFLAFWTSVSYIVICINNYLYTVWLYTVWFSYSFLFAQGNIRVHKRVVKFNIFSHSQHFLADAFLFVSRVFVFLLFWMFSLFHRVSSNIKLIRKKIVWLTLWV